MKAIITVDVPEHQIGQEVSVYFKDTMCVKSVCTPLTESDDCVSRQAVIDIFDLWWNHAIDGETMGYRIEDLPSVQPKREKHDEEIIKETVESIWGKPPYNEVLDKIKAEIEQILTYDQFTGERYSAYEFKSDVLQIIDKYRKGDKE